MRQGTHLEDVEGLKLDVAALVPEQVHHHLEVGLVGDVARHDLVVGSVEEDFSEELDRLAFGDVVGREDESRVRREELQRTWGRRQPSPSGQRARESATHSVIVGVKVRCHHRLVLGQGFLWTRRQSFQRMWLSSGVQERRRTNLQVTEGVARDSKRRVLDVSRERVETVRQRVIVSVYDTARGA